MLQNPVALFLIQNGKALNDKIGFITHHRIEFSIRNLDRFDFIQKIDEFPGLALCVFSPQPAGQRGRMKFQCQDGGVDDVSLFGKQNHVPRKSALKLLFILSILTGRDAPDGYTIGYGKRPWLAFFESLGCVLVLTMCCYFRAEREQFKGNWVYKRIRKLGISFLYSLGLFLPLVDLNVDNLFDSKAEPQWFQYVRSLGKILGWILVPLWTVAVAGLIK